jgi:hypothetical protein
MHGMCWLQKSRVQSTFETVYCPTRSNPCTSCIIVPAIVYSFPFFFLPLSFITKEVFS